MASNKKYKWNEAGWEEIRKKFMLPFGVTDAFFKILADRIDQDTQLQFKTEGARSGQPWKPFSPFTLHPAEKKNGKWVIDYSKWNPRPGTDGAKTRFYSGNSKLLQASGSFKRSFMTLAVNNKRLLYGTRYQLADEIMKDQSDPAHRPVLVVSEKDKNRYGELFKYWLDKRLIF